MAAPNVIPGDLQVLGTASFSKVSLPAGGVANVNVQAGAAGNYLAATKLQHQAPVRYNQAPGSAVVADTQDVVVVNGATGLITAFQAAITGLIATGADRVLNLDLQKSTGGAAFASVLTATLQFTNADTLRTMKSASLDNTKTAVVAGDLLRVVATVAGAAGAAAQGVVATLNLYQDPL